MIKIDYEKLKKCIFINDENCNEKDVLDLIKLNLYFLKTHNKNYTNKQYDIITTLFDILECMEVK